VPARAVVIDGCRVQSVDDDVSDFVAGGVDRFDVSIVSVVRVE